MSPKPSKGITKTVVEIRERIKKAEDEGFFEPFKRVRSLAREIEEIEAEHPVKTVAAVEHAPNPKPKRRGRRGPISVERVRVEKEIREFGVDRCAAFKKTAMAAHFHTKRTTYGEALQNVLSETTDGVSTKQNSDK